MLELAHLAASCRQVTIPGPDFGARYRMIGQFDDFLAGRKRRRTAAWLLGWLGAGPRPRGLVQRFAAGALLVAATGGSVGAVAGDTPLAMARGAVNFIGNVIQNLGPAGGAGGPTQPTPDPQATFAAVVADTPTPSSDTPTPEPPTATPVPVPQTSNPAAGAPATQPPPATPTPTPRTPAALPTATATATRTPVFQTPVPTPSPAATPSPTAGATRTRTPSPTPDGGKDGEGGDH